MNNKLVVDKHVSASEIMTREVVAVGPEETIDKVINLMARHNISGIPVVDDQNMLIGIISEKDIFVYSSTHVIPLVKTPGWLTAKDDNEDISKIYQEFEIIAATKVKDVMNPKVVWVNETTPLLEVAKKMEKKGINRVPVVDKKGKLCGIIARQDITNCMEKGLEAVSVIKKGLETVSGIMNRKVVSARPDITLDQAVKLMAKYKISGIPVVNEKKQLVGIVSERDIARFTNSYGGIPPRAAHIIAAIKSSGWLPPGAEDDFYYSPLEIMASKKVKDVMNPEVFFVEEETPILNVAKTMEMKDINRIPVINTKGELTGIVTRQDLVSYLAKH